MLTIKAVAEIFPIPAISINFLLMSVIDFSGDFTLLVSVPLWLFKAEQSVASRHCP
jgi:hypothetical protein